MIIHFGLHASQAASLAPACSQSMHTSLLFMWELAKATSRGEQGSCPVFGLIVSCRIHSVAEARHSQTLVQQQSTAPAKHSSSNACLLCLCVGWLVEAQTDELITEPRKLLVQLAIVGLGTVLLQGVHDGTCSLFAAGDQRLLHSSQCP